MRTLIIIDVQRDFMPGGALGIAGGNEIVPIVNSLIAKFDRVLATQDWHPPRHVSFASTHQMNAGDTLPVGGAEQILWPIHCVQNTQGAELADGLKKDKIKAYFHKGTHPKVDSYSAFFDSEKKCSTGLADYLRKEGLDDLYFVGLATDYCVLHSVLDALELGFKTAVIRDACRAIELHPGDEEKALNAMRRKGARILYSTEIG